MKIISVDNFDRDSIPDILICSNVNPSYVEPIVNMLNEKFSGSYQQPFFKAVPDDYVLRKFEP